MKNECRKAYAHPQLCFGLPETVKIEFLPAGVWLSQNLQVLSGSAIALTTAHPYEYGLVLGSIEELRLLVKEHQPDVGLLVIMSPDFFLAGIVIVETGEAFAFTRGAAAQKVLGEIYLGVAGGEV
ncbi:hypothetical protein IQ276_037295 [Desmonostoc muscorum LEGE 12446]|uniref:Uncharacterized protein n=1 Tax=Desmonostoc muscorum LEGE 12446 TaxID=1828758 RepID=A0A8J7ADL5_DESMC|nr:hypothetical protein [Desmonostoc muscorum]MCF2151967.1 hypothetical protein [Desmonostoc muscorum LEGE 12446]